MPALGFLADPWWVPLLFIAVVGHISNVSTTLFLHRSATHGGVKFHPIPEHFFRFWLWLTTGMITRQWVAVHRKHHAYADREGDPHSPTVEGFWEIVLGGVFFYRESIKDEELLEKYGRGCPDDWVERAVYSRFPWLGVTLVFVLDLYLFGLGVGLIVWSAMAVWLPIMGNIVNGIGHALGYRNFGTKDDSRNIIPVGMFIGGEELHNNHHADPRSAKFRAKWYEFDLGWIYIKLLSLGKLADVIYARSTSAREFASQYYSEASEKASQAATAAAAQVSAARARATAHASAAKKSASEAVHRAQHAASEAAEEAVDRIGAKKKGQGPATA